MIGKWIAHLDVPLSFRLTLADYLIHYGWLFDPVTSSIRLTLARTGILFGLYFLREKCGKVDAKTGKLPNQVAVAEAA